MQKVNVVYRSYGDEQSLDNWKSVVDAVQGKWQSDMENGVAVARTGRMTMWYAFVSSGNSVAIPESKYPYFAFGVAGADLSGGVADAKAYPVQQGQKVFANNGDGSIFIQGTFLNVQGE